MPDDNKRGEYRQLLEASAIGWMFPVAIGLGFGWGYLMDRFFGTWPWLSAIFAFFGVVAAFINLFRVAGKNG
ncbi:MAG TPA: AtpZ/AtpI family protein [Thermoanaerobaculia bacterium]|nr:AtpZ/AtpI family protein [Thermoanaerobaculia bacterium]